MLESFLVQQSVGERRFCLVTFAPSVVRVLGFVPPQRRRRILRQLLFRRLCPLHLQFVE